MKNLSNGNDGSRRDFGIYKAVIEQYPEARSVFSKRLLVLSQILDLYSAINKKLYAIHPAVLLVADRIKGQDLIDDLRRVLSPSQRFSLLSPSYSPVRSKLTEKELNKVAEFEDI